MRSALMWGFGSVGGGQDPTVDISGALRTRSNLIETHPTLSRMCIVAGGLGGIVIIGCLSGGNRWLTMIIVSDGRGKYRKEPDTHQRQEELCISFHGTTIRPISFGRGQDPTVDIGRAFLAKPVSIQTPFDLARIGIEAGNLWRVFTIGTLSRGNILTCRAGLSYHRGQ